jgi:hypothetical protein
MEGLRLGAARLYKRPRAHMSKGSPHVQTHTTQMPSDLLSFADPPEAADVAPDGAGVSFSPQTAGYGNGRERKGTLTDCRESYAT